MSNTGGNKALGIAAGVAIAAVFVVGTLALVHLVFDHFPAWNLGPLHSWATSAIVLWEAIFIVACVALWKKRRPMAIGILVSAILLGTHVLMHVAAHGLRP